MILFTHKVFSDVINDTGFSWYSDPRQNALLGGAEKFFLEAKASNVLPAADSTLLVTLELSNDNVNWLPMESATIDVGVDDAGTVTFASDFAGGAPIGRYARYALRLSGAQDVGAYVELWVTGRDGR